MPHDARGTSTTALADRSLTLASSAYARSMVVGVDLGGTKLSAGVVDASLRVHHRAVRSSRGSGQQAVLDTVVAAVEEAREAAEAPVEAVGVGIR